MVMRPTNSSACSMSRSEIPWGPFRRAGRIFHDGSSILLLLRVYSGADSEGTIELEVDDEVEAVAVEGVALKREELWVEDANDLESTEKDSEDPKRSRARSRPISFVMEEEVFDQNIHLD